MTTATPRHSWSDSHCVNCGIRKRIRPAPMGSKLPVNVEYLVPGVGWTRTRPPCKNDGGAQLAILEAAAAAPEPEPQRPTVSGTHECAARDCGMPIPLRLLMCSRHWWMLSPEIRAAIWGSYQAGQELGKVAPTREYVAAVGAAIVFIAEKEGREPAA